MTLAAEIAGRLSEAQKRAMQSGKRPNDFRAVDALALERIGVLCFTPMGDVITSPLGLEVRAHLQAMDPKG